jgi:hypothetical protein
VEVGGRKRREQRGRGDRVKRGQRDIYRVVPQSSPRMQQLVQLNPQEPFSITAHPRSQRSGTVLNIPAVIVLRDKE